MSHMKCPVCGMQTSVSRFEDAEFPVEGVILNVIGLGRARGFANDILGTLHDAPELKELVIQRLQEALNELEEQEAV